jgi:hypothetical protein
MQQAITRVIFNKRIKLNQSIEINQMCLRRRNTMRYIFTLIAAILVSSGLYAQSSVRLSVNLGSQPVWGPTGYDHADYYYIPDINSYYSVSEHRYIYQDGDRWRHSSSLPARYKGYDPYHSYKVVVNGRNPYEDNDKHQAQYNQYKGQRDQPMIRDSKESKYFVNKNHPEHNNWMKQQRHGRDHNNGDQHEKHGDKNN